jgi:hypothetical protein
MGGIYITTHGAANYQVASCFHAAANGGCNAGEDAGRSFKRLPL